MNTHGKPLKRFPAVRLCSLLLTGVSLAAQTVPARIDLVVVEGEGVVNDARQRVARKLVVRVEDDDHRPVAGASVFFALPVSSGASGEFTDGSTSVTVVTDSQGIATARGLRANAIPGKLQIYVTASYRGLRAKTLITQTVEGAAVTATKPAAKSHKSGTWKWIALAVGAAGAGGGAYLASRSHTSTPSAISISSVSVSFGGPK